MCVRRSKRVWLRPRRGQCSVSHRRDCAAREAIERLNEGKVIALNSVNANRREACRKLADDTACVPGHRSRFHGSQSCPGEGQGRVQEVTRLFAELPFIARATCLAIQAFPQINARFTGSALALSGDVDLGIAVDLSHKGLVVPVVREHGDLTLVGLAKAMNRQIEKARTGKLMADDLSGGT